MKRLFALVGLLILVLAMGRHVIAQNFAGSANQVYTNITITSSSPTSPQQLLGKIPDGVIPGCVTFGTLTNGTTATPQIIFGTNSVSGGGTPVPPGTAVAFCNQPHWQGPFYAYLSWPGTAVVSVSFTPLVNAP